MKKFEFKLESLLKLRLMHEKKTKFELGEILYQIQKIKDSIVIMNQDVLESYEAYEDFLKTPASGQMLQFFPDFVKGKKKHIEAKNNSLYALNKKYDAKVLELSKKKADVLVLVGLKEKEEEDYAKFKLRKEREALEEFVSISHYEKTRGLYDK